MKTIFTIFWLVLVSGTYFAQADTTKQKNTDEQGQKMRNMHTRFFVDLDGDGFNDNAPDHDGDGIPNGLDPDYKRMMENFRKRNMRYIDLDGDGINDHLQGLGKTERKGMQNQNRNMEPQQAGAEGQQNQNQNNAKRKGSKRGGGN
ncbi:MAG: hypothetical protein K8F36_14675 [Melioribacteraceae bacterium]|nr:hypothetical protein [Melioribacteraceae bacterium]